MALPADVRMAAPETQSLADSEIQTALDDAALEINVTWWGTVADRGTVLLAAHELCKAHPELYLGERVPKRPDPPQAAVDAGLGETVYGVAYWRIRRTLQIRGGTVV